MKAPKQILSKSYRLSVVLLLLVAIAAPLLFAGHASAATLQIVSPANGQEYSGNTFTISGTATPNAAILLGTYTLYTPNSYK